MVFTGRPNAGKSSLVKEVTYLKKELERYHPFEKIVGEDEKMNKIFEDVDVFIEVTHSNTTLTNLTGHPAVIVPIGFVEGKPTSLVFTGKLFGEAEALAVAKTYQDATDFHLKYPKL